MTALFDTLIADFEERPIPELTRRDVQLAGIPGKADVLVGMRRSGKTFVLFQEMQRLLATGVDKRCILHVNFEDDRLDLANPGLPGDIIEAFYRRRPEARTDGAFLFFDEIQLVARWPRFIRRVLDTERARVYLSGSSAKMLSTEIASEMRGRGFAATVFPFGFAESARHHGIDVPSQVPGARLRSQLEARLQAYLDTGGFPEVQLADDRVRVQTLQDYVELVLLRDIIERHDISNVHAVRAFAKELLGATASLLAVNRVYNDFRSRGLAVAKDTLYALLEHLSDAFLAFGVSVFSKSLRARNGKPRKIYAIDPGLARAMSHVAARNLGARLETAVYLELRRRAGGSGGSRPGSISYYITGAGHEVDFALGDPDEEQATALIQVCADLSDDRTRERELRALDEAMAELRLPRATVVTMHQAEEVRTDRGLIRVVPCWQWMLGLTGEEAEETE